MIPVCVKLPHEKYKLSWGLVQTTCTVTANTFISMIKSKKHIYICWSYSPNGGTYLILVKNLIKLTISSKSHKTNPFVPQHTNQVPDKTKCHDCR